MTIMLPGVEIGVSSAAQPATAVTMRAAFTDVSVAWAAATAIGTTTSTVAVLLTTWPQGGGQHEDGCQQQQGAARPDRVDQRRRHPVGRSARADRGRQGDERANQHDGLPGD